MRTVPDCPYLAPEHQHGQVVNVGRTLPDGSVRLAREIPYGSKTWKKRYGRRNLSESRNGSMEGMDLKRLPSFGRPRNRKEVALGVFLDNLRTLGRLVEEATPWSSRLPAAEPGPPPSVPRIPLSSMPTGWGSSTCPPLVFGPRNRFSDLLYTPRTRLLPPPQPPVPNCCTPVHHSLCTSRLKTRPPRLSTPVHSTTPLPQPSNRSEPLLTPLVAAALTTCHNSTGFPSFDADEPPILPLLRLLIRPRIAT